MAGLLRGRVVAITGSSSGIGRATAIACAKQGASLFLHHLPTPAATHDVNRLQEHLQTIDPTLDHTTFAADLSNSDIPRTFIRNAVADHTRLDELVNNAGICTFSNYANVTRELLERHMAINFTAAYLLSQQATVQMQSQGTGGSIVNIASITATLGSAQLTHYSATKAALLGMTVSCAVAAGPSGVRVNAISPGTTETNMNQADLDRDGKREIMASRVPLRRLGRPEDIADVVVFFASDLSRYVTGQNLLVDGGGGINYQ